ncbi:MAG: radical SAM peptide maturase [Hyphomicrobiales bacterium]
MREANHLLSLKTQGGNHYIYDSFNYNFYLTHPKLTGEINKDDYYSQKYEFIKKNLASQSGENIAKYSTSISEEEVILQLANLKQLLFEVTETCNLNCLYCGYGDFYKNEERNHKSLSFQEIKGLIDHLATYWNSQYCSQKNGDLQISFYGGEPLLQFPLIEKTIDYLQNNEINKNISYRITTNGVFLNKYYKFLVKHNFHIAISLDGNEFNNSLRLTKNSKSSFQVIFDNIKRIQQEYPEFFDQKVSFQTTLHQRNSVKGIITFFQEHFNKIPSIQELVTNDIKKEKEDEFYNTLYKNKSVEINSIKEASIKQASEEVDFNSSYYTFLEGHCENAFNNMKDLYIRKREQTRMRTGTCIPFHKKLFVTAHGKILPCERIPFSFDFGYVSKDEVRLIPSEVAAEYNRLYKSISKQCKACKNINGCTQCFYLCENIGKENTKCSDIMGKKGVKHYLADTIGFFEENKAAYLNIISNYIYE